MATYASMEFRVGERAPDDARKLRLEGFALEPSGPAQGTVLFSPGFTEPAGHCRGLLDPLADGFRVVAYSNRGHGRSEGVLAPDAAVRDLTTILAEVGGRPVLLGHSFGCYVTGRVSAASSGCYWITPYLGPSFLGLAQRIGLWLLGHGGPLVRLADDAIDRSGALRALGIPMTRVLASAAGLAQARPVPIGVPLAYLIPGRDEVVPPETSRRQLAEHYPAAEDHSHLAPELNHCLNLGFRDFRPFCKSEPGKDTQSIADAIARFSTKALKSA